MFGRTQLALVPEIERLDLDRNSVHEETNCTFTFFADSTGAKYFQLDTYGSKRRKLRGKKSQTIQLDERAARRLAELLISEFGAEPDALTNRSARILQSPP